MVMPPPPRWPTLKGMAGAAWRLVCRCANPHTKPAHTGWGSLAEGNARPRLAQQAARVQPSAGKPCAQRLTASFSKHVAARRVLDMGNLSTLAMLAGICAVASATTCRAQASDPMCQAMMVIARAANADAGAWLDRHTRNDGVEVICSSKIVQFKQFSTLPSGARNSEWRDRQQQEWIDRYCTDYAWRPALAAGWNVRLALTTRADERAEIIATCR
jgi:hypothetical protein